MLTLYLAVSLALWRRARGGWSPRPWLYDWPTLAVICLPMWLIAPWWAVITVGVLLGVWFGVRHDAFGPPGYAARRYPLIGRVVEWLRRERVRLPDAGRFARGWTEWGEVWIGASTGAVVGAILEMVTWIQ